MREQLLGTSILFSVLNKAVFESGNPDCPFMTVIMSINDLPPLGSVDKVRGVDHEGSEL